MYSYKLVNMYLLFDVTNLVVFAIDIKIQKTPAAKLTRMNGTVYCSSSVLLLQYTAATVYCCNSILLQHYTASTTQIDNILSNIQ